MDCLDTLSAGVGQALQRRGWMLATAESCTGGWVAKCITDVAGSSGWFERGFVTYTDRAKQEMLAVAAATLAEHGAVSEQTVQQMVVGALAHSRADVAVAVTGVAGPGGGTSQKPVGTVWMAWATCAGGVVTEMRCFDGDREDIRRQTVAHLLHRLHEIVDRGQA